MIKLIAIDTDGTLLNSQGEIQASTRKPSLRHLTAALKSSSVPAGQSRA